VTRAGRSAALAALVVALASIAALAGCAADSAPRTRPNAIELAALARAGGYFGTTGGGTGEWIQLWTPRQAGAAIKACVNRLSDGLVDATVDLDPSGGIGVTLAYGLGGASVEDINRFMEKKAVQEVVDRCIASTPIDTRASRLAVSSWTALYSYDATTLRRCLIARGQTVERIPDRARFENLLRSGVPWSPYDRVEVTTRADWYALSDACPAFPPEISAG